MNDYDYDSLRRTTPSTTHGPDSIPLKSPINKSKKKNTKIHPRGLFSIIKIMSRYICRGVGCCRRLRHRRRRHWNADSGSQIVVGAHNNNSSMPLSIGRIKHAPFGVFFRCSVFSFPTPLG